MDDAVLQYVPDYRVNLITPGNMAEEEIGEFPQPGTSGGGGDRYGNKFKIEITTGTGGSRYVCGA